jgi:hypothetical protein
MAIVEYEHPLEAVQAVSMFNEQQLYDRIMAVKIDLKDEGNDDGRLMKLPSKYKKILFFFKFFEKYFRWFKIYWCWFRYCRKSITNR